MLLIPAIDIKNGECVRLKQGDLEKNITVYNKDAVAQAAAWAKLGAKRIHLVDLDGAKTGEAVNAELISRMVKTIGNAALIEVGGGIRTIEQIEKYLSSGVTYVVIGTAAVKNPAFLREATEKFPHRIIVALDAKNGIVATDGWVKTTGKSAIETAKEFESYGVEAFLYTDIARDGMLSGVNVDATAELARNVSIPVIASGGMRTLDDVRALLKVEAEGVMGAVLGRSLYEGTIDFAKAQALVGDAK